MDQNPLPATSWSSDGITFRYRSPIAPRLRLGDYVAVDAPGVQLLGQLLAQDTVEVEGCRLVEGSGQVLAPGNEPRPFDSAPMTPAAPELISSVFDRRPAKLELGTLRAVPTISARLEAKGFNRHTFLCGQSGSGKTYTLGRLLEQLVLHTRLPLLVLDPNGDHVHLGTTRPDVDPAAATAYATAAAGVTVLEAEPQEHTRPLRIRLRELGTPGAAALLQLDPIGDRREYNALIHALRGMTGEGYASLDDALEAFRASGDDVLEMVRMRAENLGVDRMAAWAAQSSARTVCEVWARERPRALIADTSGFEQRRERIAVVVAVLEQLWAARKERRPLLLVVDEAHDACPADPGDQLQQLAVELFNRIAGEGRKYGIHLLLASQRPDKLPDNVLSQCDNLLLMRVNAAGDRESLSRRFGFVSPELVQQAGTFGLGECLLAGRVASHPQLARTGPRLTPEGGADVSTDWAT
jgi:uncharacterized protein